MAQKKVTTIYLKNGQQVIVSLPQGENARKAMAKGQGVFVIPDQNNRTIDVKMFGDIQDTYIEDVQAELGEQMKAARIAAPKPSNEYNPDNPGYKKFLEARRKLVEKLAAKKRR